MAGEQHVPGISSTDEAAPYEEWTVHELRKRAAELGVEGRSYMKKARLVSALRKH